MLYLIPGIVVTEKGTVVASCEARTSGSGDWGTIDILLRRSTDGGRRCGSRPARAATPIARADLHGEHRAVFPGR